MNAIILAGGSGTRFWPLSRKSRPKQLLPILGDRPLIEETVRRLDDVAERVLIVCGAAHVDPIREVLDLPNDAFVVEPEARDTAPAIALAAEVAFARFGDEPVVVLPSDHFIGDVAAFAADLAAATDAAKSGAIVTIGIPPTRPETGYGYIRLSDDSDGVSTAVAEFVEKPDVDRAVSFLSDGGYVWNAGIFVFRPSTLAAELGRQMPATLEAVRSCAAALIQGETTTAAESFAGAQRISIDYGVMENAANVRVVRATFPWSDVGHWGALSDVRSKDDDGNVIDGRVIAVDTTDSVIVAEDRLVAVVGLDGVVVVETADAVLVVDQARAQDVRAVVDELRNRDPDLL